MSAAMARYRAAATVSNWCRHESQHSGKPWQRSTVGPLPASARCIRMPFVSINRCEIVIATLRKIQSHCELQPQPKWLRRHPVERRTAKTTCSTNLFSSPHRASGSIGARSASGQSRRFCDVCFSVRYPQYRTFTSDWDWPARRLAAPELQTTGAAAAAPAFCPRPAKRHELHLRSTKTRHINCAKSTRKLLASCLSWFLSDGGLAKSEFDGFLDCIIIESLHNPIADA